ncbi:uncharacterized protein ACWYII_007436 isoform 2-T2 [Salvelinus alpinus]
MRCKLDSRAVEKMASNLLVLNGGLVVQLDAILQCHEDTELVELQEISCKTDVPAWKDYQLNTQMGFRVKISVSPEDSTTGISALQRTTIATGL